MQRVAALFFLLMFSCGLAVADDTDRLRPFVLASSGPGNLTDKVAATRQALSSNGWEVIGEYAPYAGADVLIITSDALRKLAAKSEFGGYGAAQRVAVTEVNGEIQVSYTSPQWMANVYRMAGDAADVAAALRKVLGAEKEFGSSGGRKVDNLREYHYMMFMPYFDDQLELASFGSYDEAVAAVEAGLAAGKGGTSKVYRVDVPGKDETLFGVAIKSGEGADQHVMEITDQGELRHTAHLPYEMLVSGNKVYALHGKFRIAQSFPDLTMSTFMQISGAPDAIEEALKTVATK